MYRYIFMYVFMNVYMHVYMYIYMYVLCLPICMSICTSLCLSAQACIMTVQIFAANAGNRVVHITPLDESERVKQRFITHVIYSEMSLLSSIISSIGAKKIS